MYQLLVLTLSLLPWIPGFLCKVTTEEEFTVLEGQSLRIPCHYDPQYASYVKYWCQGRTKEFCTSLARTDDHHIINPAEEKVSIFDDPIQMVFTVTMNNLKESDSAWYVCGIEIGGLWNADDTAFTNIKVVHGMSAVNSRLSGEEGSSVTVECLYSERYRESEKKWCRSGDWRSCLSTGSDGSYEDASVAIRDDRSGAFTVTFRKLQMKDTAWYWCSAGQQKISVHVLVTPRPTTATVSVTSPPTSNQTLAHLLPPKPITKELWNSHGLMLASVVVCSSLLFLVAMVLLAKKLWKQHKKDPLLREIGDVKAQFTGYSKDSSDLQNASVVFLNKNSQDVHMYEDQCSVSCNSL
ncbi:polymeric immunoglobulin receptor isoform 2-T2 [Odontesthes bonariensis]|uniref:polymeric immunoglobulin receptor isoform X2 n=1 Tax=Odontesthes bonariensis TaxID=219752 RepID=UPI003F580A00